MFMDSMKNTLNNEYNTSVTENGALGFRTSGKALLDISFAVASLRSASGQDITNRFLKAFYEDKILAMKWLFFCRDAREGLGERRLFRAVFKNLCIMYPNVAKDLIPLIPEFGRFDDLLCILDTENAYMAIEVIAKQLREDMANMKANKPVSLCAKWMPSINASSEETIRYGKFIAKNLGLSEKNYRKLLSQLRSYIDVVEVKMSSKNWGEIKYEAVPSRANLIYNNAFLKNDEQRRREFLGKLEKGETKINAGVLFPHDIVHNYSSKRTKDTTLEELWKALPDVVNGEENTIVVADGSGSMHSFVGNTTVTALEVANALAVYFAERSSGQFKDKYITFSKRPQLVDFSKASSLYDKLRIARIYNEVADTNIEAVFDLILTTAINNHMDQSELPKNILVISDMEFNSCAVTNASDGWGYRGAHPDARLFEVIAQRYKMAGYKIPRMIFWNVNSRTGTIPVKENDMGVALVSGFSINIAKMVMSNKTDPYECLVETLNSERYQPIEDILRLII